MGISLKGHSPNFQDWIFDIDGNTWVAINQSTPDPLNISFIGRYRSYPPTLPVINTSGFDIIASTTSATNSSGEKQGTVEWVWAGQKYRSKWVLSAGTEIVVGDAENAAVFEYNLNFVGRIPYDGPAGGAVGTGIATPARTKDEREAATAQISPSAQLSTAAPEKASPAPQTTTTPPQVGTGVQAPQSNKTKEDIEASTAYKTYAYSNQTPVRQTTTVPVTTTPTGITQSPVILPGTKDAREAAAAASATDWPGLLLRLGIAYALLS